MKISAQNLTPGMKIETHYGELEILKVEDQRNGGRLKISVLTSRMGRLVFHPSRMIEVVG